MVELKEIRRAWCRIVELGVPHRGANYAAFGAYARDARSTRKNYLVFCLSLSSILR